MCIEKELILNRAEIFLTYATQRAGEIIGKILFVFGSEDNKFLPIKQENYGINV